RKPQRMKSQLPVAGFTAKLLDHVTDLSNPCRAYWMAFRFQAAARINRQNAVTPGRTFRTEKSTASALDKPEILQGNNLRDRETIMNLGQLHLFRSYPRAAPGLPRRFAHRGESSDVLFRIQRDIIGGLCHGQHSNRLVREIADTLLGADYHRGS